MTLLDLSGNAGRIKSGNRVRFTTEVNPLECLQFAVNVGKTAIAGRSLLSPIAHRASACSGGSLASTERRCCGQSCCAAVTCRRAPTSELVIRVD